MQSPCRNMVQCEARRLRWNQICSGRILPSLGCRRSRRPPPVANCLPSHRSAVGTGRRSTPAASSRPRDLDRSDRFFGPTTHIRAKPEPGRGDGRMPRPETSSGQPTSVGARPSSRPRAPPVSARPGPDPRAAPSWRKHSENSQGSTPYRWCLGFEVGSESTPAPRVRKIGTLSRSRPFDRAREKPKARPRTTEEQTRHLAPRQAEIQPFSRRRGRDPARSRPRPGGE